MKWRQGATSIITPNGVRCQEKVIRQIAQTLDYFSVIDFNALTR